MIVSTPKGLFCPSAGFYVDPSARVEHAVVTHAHSDHARRGSENYYCVRSGAGLLRARLGQKIRVQEKDFGEPFWIGNVRLSFHPAGHILGSSQVRMECDGEVWVASGDYKRDPDPTCEPFEVVACDAFITEATFGTPKYRWDKNADLGAEIYNWWASNHAKGVNSVLFAYSLGKTQRVLGLIKEFMKRPVYCHPAARELTQCYRDEGISLADTFYLDEVQAPLQGELIVGPQAILKEKYLALLGENFETAFASGWMASDHFNYDRGFLLSDHADWDDLVRTAVETKAKRVFVQHRGQGALVRHLRTLGIDAHPVEKLLPLSSPDQPQLSLF